MFIRISRIPCNTVYTLNIWRDEPKTIVTHSGDELLHARFDISESAVSEKRDDKRGRGELMRMHGATQSGATTAHAHARMGSSTSFGSPWRSQMSA